MNEYLSSKKNILNHQNKSGIAVLNFDNEHTKICESLGEIRYFSKSKPDTSKTSVYLDGESICVFRNNECSKVLPVSDILIPGNHNVENYMAAIAATIDYVSSETIREIAKTFGGVEHRIELCRVLDGVKYYNSSIDSSPARSTAALRAFSQKVIMIAGGYDKNLNYAPLGDEICARVSTLILCGATANKIKKAVLESPLYQDNQPSIYECNTFEETVLTAREIAVSGDIVILSPASASFDLFKNFDQRGKVFKKLVSELS